MKMNRGQEETGAYVIDATEFKFDVRSDPGFKKPDSRQSIQH